MATILGCVELTCISEGHLARLPARVHTLLLYNYTLQLYSTCQWVFFLKWSVFGAILKQSMCCTMSYKYVHILNDQKGSIE